MKKKLALVLSGGGFSGAFQIGALKYLYDNWDELFPDHEKHFDVIAGVSVGSLNGYFVAAEEFERLCELWEEMKDSGSGKIYVSETIETREFGSKLLFKVNLKNLKSKFLSSRIMWKISKEFFSSVFKKKTKKTLSDRFKDLFNKQLKNFKSIAEHGDIVNILKKEVDLKKIKRAIFTAGTVSLNDGKYYAFSSDDFDDNENFVNLLLASSSIPVFFPPIKSIKNKKGEFFNLVDGGIKTISPLGDVISEISKDLESKYTIVVINCSAGKTTHKNFNGSSIFDIALRSMVDISLNETFNNDLKEFLRINEILKTLEKEEIILSENTIRYFDSIIIQPNEEDNLGDMLSSSSDIIEKRISLGVERAKEALLKIKQ